MWKTAARLAVLYLLRNRFNDVKERFSGDLNNIKDSLSDLVESRFAIFKLNFNNEVGRIVRSLMGYLLILVAITCSSLTAIIWLASIAVNSPNRNLIFSVTMLAPLLVGLIIYMLIRFSWKKEPLFYKSISQIEEDWQLFRHADAADLEPAEEIIK